MHPLPAPRDSFYGRRQDLGALERMLDEGARLVTLLGPAGAGKTRLALELARRRQQRTGDEVRVVALHQARTAAAAADLVAAELNLQLHSVGDRQASIAERVGEALAAQGALLLIADNFEQLAHEAEETVGCWLERAPQLRCLVTSRQALSIPGEHRYELAPLEPDDAAALLEARARAVAPQRALDDDSARQLIARLVDRLDRLPLAIELAAARAAVLPLEELYDRLDDRLALLQLQGRTSDPRHTTLRGTIDWSWSLLDDSERRALCACSVFAGGIPLEGLAAVLDASDAAALDAAQALRSKSLLMLSTTEDRTTNRRRASLGLLDSIRDYAGEQLERSGEQDELRRRHADYFLERGERLARAARRGGPAATPALDELRRDAPNIVAACRFAATSDPRAAVRLTLAISPALSLAGPHGLHRELLDDAVSACAAQSERELEMLVLVARADTLQVLGRHADAIEDAEKAARLGEQLGDRSAQARALHLLGTLRRDRGEFDAALEHFEGAATLFSELGDTRRLAGTVNSFGTLYRRLGRYDAARSSYERSLSLHREVGDPRGEGRALSGLGHLEQAIGDDDAAADSFEASLRPLRQVRDQRGIGIVLDRLGVLALLRGDEERALELLSEALESLVAIGDRLSAALAHAHRGAALAALDRVEQAAESFENAADLTRSGDSRLATAFGLLNACLSVARARQARARGDPATARKLWRNARRLLSTAPAETARYLEIVTPARRLLQVALGDRAAQTDRAAEVAAAPRPTEGTLVVLRHGTGVKLPSGEQLSLRRTPLLARLVWILVERRLDQPDAPVATRELVAKLWPDQTLDAKITRNRLYGAIAKLRRRGLEGILVRRSDGYLLHAAIPCRVSDEAI